jgi:hypothetical protein
MREIRKDEGKMVGWRDAVDALQSWAAWRQQEECRADIEELAGEEGLASKKGNLSFF